MIRRWGGLIIKPPHQHLITPIRRDKPFTFDNAAVKSNRFSREFVTNSQSARINLLLL